MIDGHARTFAAFEAAEGTIAAEYAALDQIGGSARLYKHIHRRGPGLGIRSIADLAVRVVEPEDHNRLWVGYCDAWLAEHEPES